MASGKSAAANSHRTSDGEAIPMPSSKIDTLFHRDALCQIARLVDIAATHESHFAR